MVPLKVDATAFALHDQQHHLGLFLTVINITFPVGVAQNPAELQPRLTTLETYIRDHFSEDRLTYQVTASYTLIDPTTNDRRTFTGSFQPNRLSSNSLSGALFQPVRNPYFKDELTTYMDIDRARHILSAACPDSRWQVDQILSFIVTLQAALPQGHRWLSHHQLTAPQHRRHARRHVTFYLD